MCVVSSHNLLYGTQWLIFTLHTHILKTGQSFYLDFFDFKVVKNYLYRYFIKMKLGQMKMTRLKKAGTFLIIQYKKAGPAKATWWTFG